MSKSQSGKIWVTGATGFIGQEVINTLVAQGWQVVPIIRNPTDCHQIKSLDSLVLGDLAEFNESGLLENVDCILHLAGRAHAKGKDTQDTEALFMRANRDATRALARAAAEAGVRRFVLLSSIGVLGNKSAEHPFSEESAVAPHNAYARSKWAAEQALWEETEKSSLEGVVLRSPLVYGPNPKGSLSNLMRALRFGLPLPLGAIHNRRSLIGLGNLVNLLIFCIDSTDAAGEHFLVSDREVVSITELIRCLGQAIGSPARLLPVPSGLIALMAKLIGRNATAEQLLGNLEIDSSYLQKRLDWRPPFTFEEGLAAMAEEGAKMVRRNY